MSACKSTTSKCLLDIGCGNIKTLDDGYITVGLDYMLESQADVIANIDKGCIPFKENSFDKIVLSHVLEHVSDPVKLLGEVHRVAAGGCTVIVKVPHYTNIRAYEIHHKTYYNFFSLEPLCSNPGKSAEQARMFRMIEKRIVLRSSREKRGPIVRIIWMALEGIANKYPYKYENWLSKVAPAYEVYHSLEVIK